MLLIPLFYFIFILVYRPFNVYDRLGSEYFGEHLAVISGIIFFILIFMRLLYYFLPLRLNYTLYVVWSVVEITLISFFTTFYIWDIAEQKYRFIELLPEIFKEMLFVLSIPYVILALSIRVYEFANKPDVIESMSKRMRFYDSSHNLKFVALANTIIYISAEENYVNINYLDNGKVRNYVLRASMKSIDDLCLSNGLVRCHRSFYVNPTHVKVLVKGKEGIVYAQMDADDVRDIPVSKTYYSKLAELL